MHLVREAGIKRYWEMPPAWRSALRGTEAPMLVDHLDPENLSLLEGMDDGLGQGERDQLLQEAVRILRARSGCGSTGSAWTCSRSRTWAWR